MITATSNPMVKELRSLKNKKGRRETGLFVAEGEKCVREALMYAKVRYVVATERYAEGWDDAEVVLVSERIMEAVSEAKNPQGVLAVVEREDKPLPADGMLYAALEDVSDPTNVGTIIRTADAAGAAGVLISAESADYTSARAVRASMGSIFHIPVFVAEDFAAELEKLQAAGVQVVCGHLRGADAMPEGKKCIMVGNESRGITDATAEKADALYKINMYGNAESLNAAVAAGIMLFRAGEDLFG